MAKTKDPSQADRDSFAVRFNLLGLVVFSMALIVSSGALVFMVLRGQDKIAGPAGAAAPSHITDLAPAVTPRWGEITTYDVELEHPDEYMAASFDTNRQPAWIFEGLRAGQVRSLLAQCGLTSNQVAEASSSDCLIETATNTILTPKSDLIFSLPPIVRGNLYAALAYSPANNDMFFPACFPGNSFDLSMYGSEVDEGVISLVRPLLYKRGEATFFSDFEVVLQRIPSEEQRLRLMKALTREPGVLARMRIRPTTDVEKLLGYWTQAPGVRLKDLRPLLESIKRLPDGGTISLLYFLPPFARERLYTFPMPPKAGDPTKDCHWTSMNFFNETPDNRLGDPGYVAQRLENDYYRVQRPGNYGDIIVLADERGNGIHSAVYIAEDIVFTKNGNNYLQPWLLMRLNHLVAKYSMHGTPRVAVYRAKAS